MFPLLKQLSKMGTSHCVPLSESVSSLLQHVIEQIRHLTDIEIEFISSNTVWINTIGIVVAIDMLRFDANRQLMAITSPNDLIPIIQGVTGSPSNSIDSKLLDCLSDMAYPSGSRKSGVALRDEILDTLEDGNQTQKVIDYINGIHLVFTTLKQKLEKSSPSVNTSNKAMTGNIDV